MENVQKTYLPAAGRDWALPLYDPLVKLLGGDKVRRTLLDQAALQSGHRVLEVGRVLAPGGSLQMLDFERAESQGIIGRHRQAITCRRTQDRLLGLITLQCKFTDIGKPGHPVAVRQNAKTSLTYL